MKKVIFAIVMGLFSATLGMNMNNHTLQKPLSMTKESKNKLKATFLDALKKGDSKSIIDLLDQGINIDTRNEYGDTALHLASACGHKEVVELLLDRGADVNAKNKHGDTALKLAVLNDHQEIAMLLLARGADIDVAYENNNNILMLAAMRGQIQVVRSLLARRADMYATNDFRDTALHLAAVKGHSKVVELLLDTRAALHNSSGLEAYIRAKDIFNNTALHLAARKGHKEIVKLLLDKGANSNAKGRHGNTALHLAAEKGHTEVMALLLDKDADIQAREYKGGFTALHCAAYGGHKDTVAFLLSKGIGIDAQDKDGNTILKVAIVKGHKDVAVLLLGKGANIAIKNNKGETALECAINKGYTEIAQLLELCSHPQVQEYLKDPKAYAQKDTHATSKRSFWSFISYGQKSKSLMLNKGQTTLMLACIFGHRDIIFLFKDCPYRYLHAEDMYGNTAFSYALTFNNDSITTLINTFGSKIIKTINGQLLLELALKEKNLPLVIALLSNYVELPFKLSRQSYLKSLPKELMATLLLMLKERSAW